MRLQCTIEADLQTWITKNLKTYLDQEEKAIHTFVSNVKSFVKSYQRTFFEINPFKETALSPYIHVKNGAIEIIEDDFIFHKRSEKTEEFYRNLYPMHCLDVEFDMKYYKNDDLDKSAPMFYKYVYDMIPESVLRNKSEEIMTFDMFSQIIGYTINPRKMKEYFFAFYGKQESGKSFFIDILKTIIPVDFFTETPVKNMDNRFAASSLFGSKVYVDDDFKAGASLPDDFIKAYSGKNTISIEYKNQNTIKGITISIAMFFLSNHVFTVQGGPEGIERRFIFLPFRKSVKSPDVYMLDKMIGKRKKDDGSKFDERAAILGFAMRGIKLMQENGFKFVMPPWVESERNEWIQNSSSITQFMNEEVYDKKKGYVFNPPDFYEEYKTWCGKNDKKSYGRNSFYEALKQDDKIEFYHDKFGNHFKVKGGVL
jgi:P4 family phage/plasmid primase-like protien